MGIMLNIPKYMLAQSMRDLCKPSDRMLVDNSTDTWTSTYADIVSAKFVSVE